MSYKRGYGIIEIILAVFILSLIATLTLPKYLSSISSISLDTLSNELIDFIHLSQYSAKNSHQTVTLNITLSETSISSIYTTLPNKSSETHVTIPNILHCTSNIPIGSIQFNSDATWTLYSDNSPLTQNILELYIANDHTSASIQFYPFSNSIQLIKSE